ncbi:hypothetical protein D3C75_943930 [compost metagenome]
MRILICAKARTVNQVEIFGVVELAVSLEIGFLTDGIFHLIVTGTQAQRLRVLVQQRLVDQLRQHLLAHLLHITFVASHGRETVAQFLLHTATFTLESLFQLGTFDHLAIYFRSVIAGTSLIADHPSQKK